MDNSNNIYERFYNAKVNYFKKLILLNAVKERLSQISGDSSNKNSSQPVCC